MQVFNIGTMRQRIGEYPLHCESRDSTKRKCAWIAVLTMIRILFFIFLFFKRVRWYPVYQSAYYFNCDTEDLTLVLVCSLVY